MAYINQSRNARLKKRRGQGDGYINQSATDDKNRGGIGAGLGYLAANLGLGAAGVGEGIGDLLAAGGDLLRGDTEMAKYRFLDNKTADAQRKLQESYNPGIIMKGAGDVASGIGNSLIFLIPYAGPYLAGAGYMGMGVSNAAEQTGDVGLKELRYGVVSGGLEFALDKFTGGIGKAGKNIGSAVSRKLGREAVESTAKATGRSASKLATKLTGKSLGKAVAIETAKGALGEAAEEALAEAIDPTLLNLFHIDENARFDIKNVAYAGLIGGLSGGLMTAGPAAINYKSAAKAGRAIRESGETADFLEHTRLVLGSAAKKKTRLNQEAEKKTEVPADAGRMKKATTAVSDFMAHRKASKTASGVDKLVDTIGKNLKTYESYLQKADKTEKELEISDAVLGELRGNVFLLENAALLEVYEDAILELDDEDKAEIVGRANTMAKEQGRKRFDYTVEDLNNNTDDILTFAASNYMLTDGYGRYLRKAAKPAEQTEAPAEPTESPVEPAQAPETAMDEQQAIPEAEPVQREYEGDERTLRESAKGLGLSDVETDMMVNTYKYGSAMDADTFSKAFAEGVYYGRQNRRAEDVSKNTLLGTMSESERSAAIEAGRIGARADTERRAALAAQKTASAPMVSNRVRLDLKDGAPLHQRGDREYGVYNASKIIGSALNADVVIHDTLGEKNGHKLNGYFNRKDNTMHLALDAGKDGNSTALYTLAHEATHYVREWSPEKYQVLSDFIGQRMSARGEDMDAMIAAKKELLKKMEEFKDLSDSALTDAAHEEVIADAMETVLSDGKVLQELAERDKSLWEKVKAWVREAITRLKAAYAELKPNSQAAKVLKETMTSMEEIERLFTEGVTAAGERAKGADVTRMNEEKVHDSGGIVNSLSKTKEQKLKEDLQKLGLKKIKKETDSKTIVILTDDFTVNKNIYSNKGRSSNEVNARIKHIPIFDQLIKQSVFEETATDIRDIEKDAKKGVVAMHKFTTRVDGYLVEILVRDKGDKQYLYEVKFKGIKKDPQQSMAGKSAFPAPKGDAEDGEIIPQERDSVNTESEISQENPYDTEHGVMIDDESGTAMFSVEDIPKTESEVDAAVNRLVKKLGVDEARARSWVEAELSLATLILRDDMVDYAHRKADRRLTAIVKNSDYKQGTLDFSNICRKRREYTRMMQRIQQAFPNRRFTAEEFATIRQIMVDEGLEVACGLCYVEDRRQNEGYIAESFQRAVKSWRAGNKETFFDTKNETEKAYSAGAAKAMSLIEDGDYMPTIADLTTVDGMDKLQREHPDLLRAWRGFNNARGMASARLLTGEAEYQRQILKYNKAKVKQINDLGGLRVFSFSDFEEFHLIDIVQAVQDCAAMGIKIQFYTKVPSFALLMKDTKAKGNLSLIPKGDLGYVMMNGKPVLAYDPVEGIDFNDPAFKKVVRGNPNIGTILVGINDTQIRAAMEDPYVDYIIPFHTGQSAVVRQIKKIGKWENYKDVQTDKPVEAGSKAKPVNVYTDVIAAAEREGKPIRNEKQFVERFLNVCEERGLTPRFAQFLNKDASGKYVYTKGYYKLLLDFKMFDKDGTYLPQEPVVPEFDPELLHELTEKYVAGEKAKVEKSNPDFDRALKRVAEEVIGDQTGIVYSVEEDSAAKEEESQKIAQLAEENKRLNEENKKLNQKIKAMERKAERAEKETETVKEEYREREQYRADSREVTTRRRAAIRVLGQLGTMLYRPTKARHVPSDMEALVSTVLRSADTKQFAKNRDHLRQMSELAVEIERLERKAALTGEEQDRLNKMKSKFETLEADTLSVKEQADVLLNAFESYQKVAVEKIDENLMKALRADVIAIEKAPLAEMNLASLRAVEHFYKTLFHQINTENEAFATAKAERIDSMSTKASDEVKSSKPIAAFSPTGKEWKALAGIRKFLWANMKPLTVFEVIGSPKLQELFNNILDGEETWIKDVMEAKEHLDKAKKKYGYNKWNLTKRTEIKTANGEKVSLTLGEMMSLYAYMFRDQAEQHLSEGGFTFAPDATTIENFKDGKIKYEAVLNDQKQYKMRREDIAAMSALLTEEQKQFAREVQQYLTSLGAKGNEVSKKLYGLELFKEEAYFPIKSNRDYLATSTGKSGDPNIKDRGTFKETTPNAGNPIVLEDFMKVVSGHVNTMATYHAFVLPVEDFTRVWNYRPVNIKKDSEGNAILDEHGNPIADSDAGREYNSLKAEIASKYGHEANDYILQMLRDLNGGARSDATASILDKGITGFKRAATGMSMSTIIQQPTSILRAMAYVDPKYFRGAKRVPWDKVMKLAPVAGIKEIGGHDTGTGARTDDYLNAREYDSKGEKLKAALIPKAYGGDPKARDDYFGYLPAMADKIAWQYMFGAVLNEQADKLGKPIDSKEVEEAAAKRFTEVVRRTQVYDSTLTRTQLMRSKDRLWKIVTAFGAEPATVLSMLADGWVKYQRGDKKFFRDTGGAVAMSIIATAAASSLIYAMRDDDEEETYSEKYVESLTSELIEGFNPAEYVPIARDVASLFKGYEIERTDMALVGNLLEQVEMITSSKRSVPDKIFGVTGAVSAFFGVPVTNVYRDVKGLYKTTAGLMSAEEQTASGYRHAAGDAVRGQFNLLSKMFGAESGNAYELYTAYVRGDTAHYERVSKRYESPEAVEQALRKELRENDKRIAEAAEARMNGELDVYESIVEQIDAEGIFDRNIVIRAVNNEISAMKATAERGGLAPKAEVEEEPTPESIYQTSDLNAALERGDAEDFTWIYHTLMAYKQEQGKTEAQARSSIKSSLSTYWKKRYTAAWEENNSAEMKRILQILLSTGLYGSHNDTATTLEGWVKAYAKAKRK